METLRLLDNIPESEKTPLVNWLLEIIKQQDAVIQSLQKQLLESQKQNATLQERVHTLEKELRQIKKLKEKPTIKPSTLNKDPKVNENNDTKRPGSKKHSKKSITINEVRDIEPDNIPADAVLVRTREFDVQDIIFQNYNIRFNIKEYRLPDGTIISGKLPEKYDGHFGPSLKTFILYQHYSCGVPQHLIFEQMREWCVDISEGQINRILTEKGDAFHTESENVLQAGMQSCGYLHTDDTGARHAGKNASCNVIGNDLFTYFYTSDSKSRENFLKILRGSSGDYLLNEDARRYLEDSAIKDQTFLAKIPFSDSLVFDTESKLGEYLAELGIKNKLVLKNIKESAIFACAVREGLRSNMVLLSDGAPQFNILIHALCWVHAERLLRKLPTANEEQVANIERIRREIWEYYQELKQYKNRPMFNQVADLEQRFDAIFSSRFTEFPALDEALIRLQESKSQLLLVLRCPIVPLHNNGAEGDIREYVTRRKRSGGTRSNNGRKTLDSLLGLKKTCRKMGISFWEYLSDRLHKAKKILPLDDILRSRTEGATII